MILREHEAVRSKGDVFRVDPRLLKVDPGFNVRDLDAPTARESLDELKEQIREQGVAVPLEIRLGGEDVFIVSGHRRHRVVMELIAEGVEILTIPAMAEPKTISAADRVARLITLNAGEPLTSLEKAEVIRRLLGYGWDRAQIAKRLGFKSPQTVANYEELLAAPEPVRDAVRSGELSATSAVSMLRTEGDGATEALGEARKVAKARGKTKITAKSIAKPKAPAVTRTSEHAHEPPPDDLPVRQDDEEAADEPFAPAPAAQPAAPPPQRPVARLPDAMPEGSVAYYIKPGNPQSAFENGLAMAIKASTELDAGETAGAYGLPLYSDDLSRFIEWLMDFESKFRSKHHGAGNEATQEAAD